MAKFKVTYEAMDKMHRIIIEAKNESAAYRKLEQMLIRKGLEAEAEVYSIEEIE